MYTLLQVLHTMDNWKCLSEPERMDAHEINSHARVPLWTLEVLKWARENGCPWNEHTCLEAATNGYFEVLKWARENGYPRNDLFVHRQLTMDT